MQALITRVIKYDVPLVPAALLDLPFYCLMLVHRTRRFITASLILFLRLRVCFIFTGRFVS